MNTESKDLLDNTSDPDSSRIKTKAMEESFRRSARSDAKDFIGETAPLKIFQRWISVIEGNWSKDMDAAVRDGYWQHEWRPDLVDHCRAIEEMLRLSVKEGMFRGICAGALTLYFLGYYAGLSDGVAALTSLVLGTSRYDTCLTQFCESICQ